ncbi:MAG: sugar transferase [Paludibacteraceae bacterium]|nr:sugar transferase [Paludibacteraceae bacterium]
MIYKAFKRSFDFVSSLLLFVIISPLFLVLMICARISIGSPIFFYQERSGRGAKSFKLMKFRTMTNAKDAEGKLLPDNERLTKFGRFLRNSSLDELPELLNIIKGDMAVIGPRPLYPRYNAFYTEYERNRFKVRGGLIPPESLYHDSFLTWDKQLQYEADYALNLSLKLDAMLLISVFTTMLRRNKEDYGAYTRKPLDVERSSQ